MTSTMVAIATGAASAGEVPVRLPGAKTSTNLPVLRHVGTIASGDVVVVSTHVGQRWVVGLAGTAPVALPAVHDDAAEAVLGIDTDTNTRTGSTTVIATPLAHRDQTTWPATITVGRATLGPPINGESQLGVGYFGLTITSLGTITSGNLILSRNDSGTRDGFVPDMHGQTGGTPSDTNSWTTLTAKGPTLYPGSTVVWPLPSEWLDKLGGGYVRSIGVEALDKYAEITFMAIALKWSD